VAESTQEAWDSGDAYEAWVGRWSRPVAAQFIEWLAMPPGLRWADVGCGTGALSELILRSCEPASIVGVDRAPAFVAVARRRIADPRASFEVGDATALPWPDARSIAPCRAWCSTSCRTAPPWCARCAA
jgi:trans-aconitate methyltransferase